MEYDTLRRYTELGVNSYKLSVQPDSLNPETDYVLISYQNEAAPQEPHGLHPQFSGIEIAMDAVADAHNNHVHGMAPPPDSSAASPEMMHHKMMMHMTFFWGTNAEILFNRWPGDRAGMYALALLFVFAISFLVEFLSHCRLTKEDSSPAAAGLIRTLLHTVRVGLAYLVMLAVMSFNVGVLLVAIGGHCLGFFLFGSRFFNKSAAAAAYVKL